VPSRFDAGTVYVTADVHRLNDYETHMWVSHDFGATFASMNGNLKGEAVKTLTEDQKNPDVLYVGTETGIFFSLDRGKSWTRLKTNFPNIRTDEITLHPRDNAMIVATHGRGIWILDHLEPIQEYTQAVSGAADAHLFTPGPALQWKQWDDRNDEFWAHQFFVGENPPTEAVLQLYLKKALTDVKLKITDAAGKEIRTLVVPANRLQPGIQSVCWDQRVEPLPTQGGGGQNAGRFGAGGGGAGGGAINPADPAAAAAAQGRGAGGGGGRGGGGWNTPQPEAGNGALNVCGGFGGGGGGGRGTAPTPLGPEVLPGTYSVALVVDGKTVETKPLKIVADTMQEMNDAQKKRYYDMAMDLHDMQRRAEQMSVAISTLSSQMPDVATKVKDSKAPDAVKTQFAAFQKDFETVQAKFSAPAGGGGRGGRGGGGGAAAGGAAGGGRGGGRAAGAGAAGATATTPPGGAPPDAAAQGPAGFAVPVPDESIVGKVGVLKAQVLAFEEMPSETYMKEYASVKSELPKALADANAFLIRASAMSQTLKKYDITLNAPAPVK
jgi:hypothetical protein